MNILVIGNGFDLAHGLPTKYGDFLEFVKVMKQIMKVNTFAMLTGIEWKNINSQIGKLIRGDMDTRKFKMLIEKYSILNVRYNMLNAKYRTWNIRNSLLIQGRMWNELLNDNIWIDYFLQCDMFQSENWVDFESEISDIIQSIEIEMERRNNTVDSNIYESENKFLNRVFLNNQYGMFERDARRKRIFSKKQPITYRQLIHRLESDLNKLIMALNMYLFRYIQKMDITMISPDIKEIYPDKVLSFNYTNTYQRIYDIEYNCAYDYVHGIADGDINLHRNNMVLGIDEYLEGDRKDKKLEFIAFKKYYQRICKQTGCTYKEWIDEIRMDKDVFPKTIKESSENDKKNIEDMQGKNHNLYIFGHSLDVTDKDILRNLILNDNIKITIFYNKSYDKNGFDDNGKKSLGEKVSNLVKVIGQDELIRRTGGSTKTIEFKLQRDMEEK